MSETIQVKFHGLATGGSVVGKVIGPEGSERVGMTAFVPFATPGTEADVTVTVPHKRHVEATLTKLPKGKCQHFTVCGGCDLQHLDYTEQLQLKRDMVASALQKGGLPEVEVAKVVPSAPYGWRRRVTLHVNAVGEIGYRPRGTHDLLTPKMCPVADSTIEAFLKKGFKFPAKLPHGGTFYLEVGEDDQLYGMLRTGMLDKEGMIASAEALDARVAGGVVEVARNSEIRFGDVDNHPTLGSFSQANGEINEKLQKAVVAGAGKAETALDLYAGAGNFAFPLVAAGLGVTAVESDIALVAAAREEARKRGMAERLQVIRERVEVYLKKDPAPVEYLVADPPRTGLGTLAPRLTFAQNMALISCDLAVAVRDLKALQESGWKIGRVTPFDMFPQTAHIELLTLLSR
ncbi:MAG: hypothetical protein QM758_18435 [Armatimonas sp.]